MIVEVAAVTVYSSKCVGTLNLQTLCTTHVCHVVIKHSTIHWLQFHLSLPSGLDTNVSITKPNLFYVDMLDLCKIITNIMFALNVLLICN